MEQQKKNQNSVQKIVLSKTFVETYVVLLLFILDKNINAFTSVTLYLDLVYQLETRLHSVHHLC